MRRSVIVAASALLVLSSAGCAGWPSMAPAPSSYAAALSDSIRPAEDRARDEARHTAETLAFARVRPGQKIADMIIGGGYFTRVFSAAVGSQGHVTAWQPAEFIGFQASYGESLTAVDALPNVDAIRSPIGAPEFPSGLDLVFTAQNYHDLHLAPFPADVASRVNVAVFRALKPGGLYVIVDHHALAGSGLAGADTLHRIDIEAVKREVTAAGFVLNDQSDLLADAADPRTASVFDPSIRGKTSQFMLRFRKPG
ncbi:putative methyltransferase [Brevundimonas alba]|uniref:Putative methyltransferase n=1 Tax=Brevundimonas alba TaxID=74314 RepID=A0A7X5YP58_9CAUL|nr:class I SAM-dependent methyltransferase [Brevundimonas alba]NJC42294.1 putative methyltransferase [Brevundimonas alba]